jgi:AGZA family xanthine/uracil permease-like MFS transporter
LIEIGNIFASPDFSWFFKLNLVESLSYSFIPIVFSLLFVDMFDSITTFVGLSEASGLVDENGDPKNMKKAMITDGFATFFSSLFGTSSGTAYVESAVGIEQGGRSGLTAVVTGLLFIPFLFIAPLAAAVPSLATAPALVMVGFFMSSALKNINWKDAENAIPAFLTIILIPLTYSLTQGLVFGLLSYSLIKIFVGKTRTIPLILWIINGFSILLLCIEYKIL